MIAFSLNLALFDQSIESKEESLLKMTNNFAFPGDGDDDALVSTRRLVLLASVCSGILMCKIVSLFVIKESD